MHQLKHHLFLNHKTIDEWRALARSTHRPRFDRLIHQANSYFEYLPPVEHPRETITYIGMAVANLALAYRLTDEERCLTRACDWIKVAIGYPHWGKAHMPDQDLDAGWLLFGLGLGYDWLRDFLPEDVRDAMRAKLVLQGSRLYDFAVRTEGQWWSSAYWQNHNWICYAGLATAAYSLECEYPDTKAWSQRALENFQSVLSLLADDGSDYEGVVYWCYGFPWLLIAADLLQQQENVDLHQAEFLRHTFYYRLYASAPNLIDTMNFGDCHDRRSAHALAIYYRLASVYRNGHAQWLAEYFENTGEWERERREGLLKPSSASHAFLEFLWYDPTVKPESIASLKTARVFPDLGLVTTRTDWSPNATVVAFKCGKPNGEKAWTLGHNLNSERGWNIIKTGHAHPDENSFIIARGRDYNAVDEGYSQKKQSRHHNTILVDGKGQYHEGVYNVAEGLASSWGGKLEESFISKNVIYARGQAAGAYDPALTLDIFTRQMLVIENKYIVLCDDLRSREPRRFDWLLQTDAPLQLAPSRNSTAVLAQFENRVGHSRLHVAVIEPSKIVHNSIEQEIVAYPSSSTPEWVLRHTQHTLMLTPDRTNATRFVVVLTVDAASAPDPRIEPLASEHGSAIQIEKFLVAFARDSRNIEVNDKIVADARWVVANLHDGRIVAGDSTRVSIQKQLCHSSAEPRTIELDEGRSNREGLAL